MIRRALGKTGIDVGEVGLGTEYLNGQSKATVASVIGHAADSGVDYIDVLFSFPDYLDNLGAAMKGRRDDTVLAGHLGCAETDGQYRRTRDLKECEANFEDMLRRLGTDHVDVVFLQNCDELDDYHELIGPGGLLELAQRYRQQGKARFIGISGHTVPVALKAATSHLFDVLMFSINPAFDALAGDADVLDENAKSATESPNVATRKDVYLRCAAEGIAVVAMKAFAGGRLLSSDGDTPPLTPVQCLSYVLAQPAVATAVPGPKSLEELRASLAYLHASEEEKDFGAAIARPGWNVEGSCVYCNHCLPCPSLIDIGAVLRLLDSSAHGLSSDLASAYGDLSVKASACVECGECMERCPFGVDVIEKLNQAARVFER